MKYRLPISVVMPSYNSDKYVASAIDIILNRNFADFELIIDDGSNDNSVVELTEHTDDRIWFYGMKGIPKYVFKSISDGGKCRGNPAS